MKMKKVIAVLLFAGMMGELVSGCGKSPVQDSDTVYVGVTYYNQSDTFLNEMLDCFKADMVEQETDQLQTSVSIRDASGSQRTQIEQVEELISAGCDVLCVNLVERADPSEIIDLAKDNDIPIIFFNREPVAEDLMQWDKLYYIGADAKESGTMQGELAAELIEGDSSVDRNGDGKIQYVVLEGEPGHQDGIVRTENAVNTLKGKGIALEKLEYGIANWNRAQAQNRMAQLISKYHNEIELVLSNNDDMALGAMDAYLNYTETTLPVFFGVDGTDVGLEAVKDGKMAGTVYNDKEGQAENMAQLAIALATGKGMSKIDFVNERYVYVPYSKVNSENVDEYMTKDKK